MLCVLQWFVLCAVTGCAVLFVQLYILECFVVKFNGRYLRGALKLGTVMNCVVCYVCCAS